MHSTVGPTNAAESAPEAPGASASTDLETRGAIEGAVFVEGGAARLGEDGTPAVLGSFDPEMLSEQMRSVSEHLQNETVDLMVIGAGSFASRESTDVVHHDICSDRRTLGSIVDNCSVGLRWIACCIEYAAHDQRERFNLIHGPAIYRLSNASRRLDELLSNGSFVNGGAELSAHLMRGLQSLTQSSEALSRAVPRLIGPADAESQDSESRVHEARILLQRASGSFAEFIAGINRSQAAAE